MIQRMDIPGSTGKHDAVALVDAILCAAIERRASDVHIEPTADGAEVRLRVDGLLETHSQYSAEVGRSLVARLMVMAHLLTYRLDIPQEGRMRVELEGEIVEPFGGREPGTSGGDARSGIDRTSIELRLAVMPTTHGLRAALRMPAELIQPRSLERLGLPANALAGLKRFASGDAGMFIVTGPAGSGKTTTIYALLEHIARVSPGLSLVALEDPVERDIPGVTQIEVSPFGQLTYERALRSMLRQDPQVLMLGEIRDAATASLAAQAALSGHRLICTLHASTPGGAITRLLEMGLEPYRITSALYGVLAQRLLRRLAPRWKGEPLAPSLGTPEEGRGEGPARQDVRPSIQSRYQGRIPAAEFVPLTPMLRAAILTGADAAELQQVAAKEDDYSSLRDSADSLVAQHLTDIAEVCRVLGETNE